MYTYKHTCIHTNIHVYIQTYMYTYKHTCIHTNIHTALYVWRRYAYAQCLQRRYQRVYSRRVAVHALRAWQLAAGAAVLEQLQVAAMCARHASRRARQMWVGWVAVRHYSRALWQVCMCMYVCVCACMRACMCVRVCTCVRVCIRLQVCMQTYLGISC